MQTEKSAEEGIRRVVWVPQKLDQEIEGTRKKIGYTRSAFYRYAITRLMEQMLLSTRKEVKLRPWEEIVGTLKTIETDNQTTTAIISCTQNLDIALPYPKDTPEANTIQNLNKHLGKKIRILKTDNQQQPLTITTYTATPDTKKSGLWHLQLRRSLFCVAPNLVALNFALWLFGLRLTWWF
jgi:hypothetical protein